MIERLQKYMARCGVASRRSSENIILSGRVKINDIVIKELGYKVDSDNDKVYVDDNLILPENGKVYIVLNKPTGYVSTVKDERGRNTIMDLIEVSERIYPIGRLDYDTSGLILLTNDGDIYNRVIHPRQSINKVYIAKIKGIPSKDEISNFCSGVNIGDYITSNAGFKILTQYSDTCDVEIIIHEGKNRQIRRMCEAINHSVIKLKRIAVGDIVLNNLKEGCWRYLNQKELKYLERL
ncbi:MAG: pseudouridine synthase [Bacillota bacterium]|nr:pseudouridine synthase [Bacillota bacterium]